MSAFHAKLLADLGNDAEKLLKAACDHYEVSANDLSDAEKVMVVLAMSKRTNQ